jgi:hypothetical protein
MADMNTMFWPKVFSTPSTQKITETEKLGQVLSTLGNTTVVSQYGEDPVPVIPAVAEVPTNISTGIILRPTHVDYSPDIEVTMSGNLGWAMGMYRSIFFRFFDIRYSEWVTLVETISEEISVDAKDRLYTESESGAESRSYKLLKKVFDNIPILEFPGHRHRDVHSEVPLDVDSADNTSIIDRPYAIDSIPVLKESYNGRRMVRKLRTIQWDGHNRRTPAGFTFAFCEFSEADIKSIKSIMQLRPFSHKFNNPTPTRKVKGITGRMLLFNSDASELLAVQLIDETRNLRGQKRRGLIDLPGGRPDTKGNMVEHWIVTAIREMIEETCGELTWRQILRFQRRERDLHPALVNLISTIKGCIITDTTAWLVGVSSCHDVLRTPYLLGKDGTLLMKGIDEVEGLNRIAVRELDAIFREERAGVVTDFRATWAEIVGPLWAMHSQLDEQTSEELVGLLPITLNYIDGVLIEPHTVNDTSTSELNRLIEDLGRVELDIDFTLLDEVIDPLDFLDLGDPVYEDEGRSGGVIGESDMAFDPDIVQKTANVRPEAKTQYKRDKGKERVNPVEKEIAEIVIAPLLDAFAEGGIDQVRVILDSIRDDPLHDIMAEGPSDVEPNQIQLAIDQAARWSDSVMSKVFVYIGSEYPLLSSVLPSWQTILASRNFKFNV